MNVFEKLILMVVRGVWSRAFAEVTLLVCRLANVPTYDHARFSNTLLDVGAW